MPSCRCQPLCSCPHDKRPLWRCLSRYSHFLMLPIIVWKNLAASRSKRRQKIMGSPVIDYIDCFNSSKPSVKLHIWSVRTQTAGFSESSLMLLKATGTVLLWEMLHCTSKLKGSDSMCAVHAQKRILKNKPKPDTFRCKANMIIALKGTEKARNDFYVWRWNRNFLDFGFWFCIKPKQLNKTTIVLIISHQLDQLFSEHAD